MAKKPMIGKIPAPKAVAAPKSDAPTVRKPRTVGSRKRATAKGAAQRLAGLKL